MAKQLIAITAAFTPILATRFSSYVEIQEDGSGSAAGLKVQFPDDNFTATYEYPVGAEPIKIGKLPVSGEGSGRAPLVGLPAQSAPVPQGNGTYSNNQNPATVYCKVASMGANTVIRVDERP